MDFGILLTVFWSGALGFSLVVPASQRIRKSLLRWQGDVLDVLDHKVREWKKAKKTKGRLPGPPSSP